MTKLLQLDLISDNYVPKLWKKLKPMILGSELNKNSSLPQKPVDITQDPMDGQKMDSLNLKDNITVESAPQTP